MMGIIGKKSRSSSVSELIVAFVQSWEMRSTDETTVCSSTLDLIRAYLGDRPCAVWKKTGSSLSKISERGMVEIFYSKENGDHQATLARALTSGAVEFDACDMNAIGPEFGSGYVGFLHVPIKIQESIMGILTLAANKKESRDINFIQPLECLGRLMAVALKTGDERDATILKERTLRSEVEATSRELEQTNKLLIERVKELKMLSSELEHRVQDLTVANRAKDEFLSVVSHELRTPLTSLNGFLCVLLDGEAGPINEEQKKFLSIAKHSSTRLNLLISDLLDISRIESGRLSMDMKSCSLFDIMHTSVQNLAPLAESKTIHLRFESNPTLPSVWGDPSRLQQVVDNLIGNAIKFSDKESTVSVFAEEKGDFIEVGVRDSGPGLNPDQLHKVFDKFYQVDGSSKRAAGGAGLGLAIARGIVSLHGGNIWVESEPGKGATFKFLVPRSKQNKAAA